MWEQCYNNWFSSIGLNRIWWSNQVNFAIGLFIHVVWDNPGKPNRFEGTQQLDRFYKSRLGYACKKKKTTFMGLFICLIIINPKRILVRLRLSVWQLVLSLKIPLSQPKTPSLHLHARTRRNATWVCTSSHEATNSPQRHNAAHLGLLFATRCRT